MSTKKDVAVKVVNFIEQIFTEQEGLKPEIQLEAIEGVCISLCSLMAAYGIEPSVAKGLFGTMYDSAYEYGVDIEKRNLNP